MERWWGGYGVDLFLILSPSPIFALLSFFYALSCCQCLVTLPSLMAFLCSIFALHPPPMPFLLALVSQEPHLRYALFFLSPPINQYSTLPPCPQHTSLTFGPLINYGWGPLTSHLKFLLCLSMDDRYITSSHPQSTRRCCSLSTFISSLFFLFFFVCF